VQQPHPISSRLLQAPTGCQPSPCRAVRRKVARECPATRKKIRDIDLGGLAAIARIDAHDRLCAEARREDRIISYW